MTDLYIESRWEMYDYTSGGGIGIRHAATGRKVAHVPPGRNDLDNARKIAAAPAMLSLLERMHKDIARGVMPGSLGSLVTMLELGDTVLHARGE